MALHLMSTSKITAGVAAGLLIAAAIGTAIHESTMRTAAESRANAARREHEQVVASLRDTRARIAALNTIVVALRKGIAESQATLDAAAQEKRPRAAAKTLNPSEAGKAFMERHPEVKQALADWFTTKEDFRWGKLFEKLKLSPEQIARFRTINRETEFFGRSIDSEGNEWAQFDLKTGRPWQESQQELQSMLARDGFREYVGAVNEQYPFRFASQAVADLLFTESSMSNEQAAQLFVTIKNNFKVTQGGASFSWDKIESEAGQFLSPAQASVISHLEAEFSLSKAQQEAATKNAPKNQSS